MIIADFETRSQVNLFEAGSYIYAQHESTDILCCGFIPVNEEGESWEYMWYPSREDLPDWLYAKIVASKLIAAHNAGFDRLIWRYVGERLYGMPPMHLDRWYCTAAQCRANNLPAALEDATRALTGHSLKNPDGKYLINQLSIPQPDGTFREDEALLTRMGNYCLDDCKATKTLVECTRQLSASEQIDWEVNEVINDNGVPIDFDLAYSALRYADEEKEGLATEFSDLTGGLITSNTQYKRAQQFLIEQLGEGHLALDCFKKYVADEVKFTFDKNARATFFDDYAAEEFDVPNRVYDFVELYHNSSMSSISKFKNMLTRASGGRVHGAFIYNGAAQTGRYASRGLQIHNFPSRGLFKTDAEVEATRQAMVEGADIAKPTLLTLKKMLRPAIKARADHTLVIGDWTGIEARVLPWLADSEGSNAKLARIYDGADVYLEAAAAIGMADRRDVGKVMELALGYEGGANAFTMFARGYGVSIPTPMIKHAIAVWRELNYWVVRFWRDLEAGAMHAVLHPGYLMRVGRVGFIFDEKLMKGSLLCVLPDGGAITYPQCEIGQGKYGKPELTAMKASRRPKAGDRKWPRESLYGGRLAGHVTQGCAATLLKDLLDRVDAGIPIADIIAHVHDEVVLETRVSEAKRTRSKLKTFMTSAPSWAEGLKLNAEPIISERFKK